MAVFNNCSCPGDRMFLGEILSGPLHEIAITPDLTMHGIKAEVRLAEILNFKNIPY